MLESKFGMAAPRDATYDVFISYAWSKGRNEWVRLLAAQLHLIGFSVGYDGYLGYGQSLNTFMQSLSSAKHVLVVVDDNYLQRMNKENSGVWKEFQEIRQALDDKPDGWLGIIAIDNPDFKLPSWAEPSMIKCFDCNIQEGAPLAPAASTLEDIWRWCADMPVDKSNAEPPALIARWAKRIEMINGMQDPAHWAYPYLEGEETFEYPLANGTCRLGYDPYSFALQVSRCGADNIYVYSDPIKAVWLLPEGADDEDCDKYLRSDRAIVLEVGRSAILMNELGRLCKIDLLCVREENKTDPSKPASITFRYRILLNK